MIDVNKAADLIEQDILTIDSMIDFYEAYPELTKETNEKALEYAYLIWICTTKSYYQGCADGVKLTLDYMENTNA